MTGPFMVKIGDKRRLWHGLRWLTPAELPGPIAGSRSRIATFKSTYTIPGPCEYIVGVREDIFNGSKDSFTIVCNLGAFEL